MIRWLICRLRGHQDQWPVTTNGRTTVTCARCQRTSSGLVFDRKPLQFTRAAPRPSKILQMRHRGQS